MYVKTVDIGFYEPYTGFWVGGTKEVAFRDAADEEKTLNRWRKVFQLEYGACYVEIVKENVQ